MTADIVNLQERRLTLACYQRTAETHSRLPPDLRLEWEGERNGNLSIKLLSQVWELQALTQPQKLVLLALAYHADDDGLCWPSVATLGHKAMLSERQARRVVRQLELKGLVRRIPTAGRSNRYFVTPDITMSAPPPRTNRRPVRADKAMSGASDIQMSAESSRNVSESSLREEALQSREESLSNMKALADRLRMKR